jgi:hypothetical protein
MIRVLTTSEVYYAAYDRFIAHDAERHSPTPRADRSLRFVDVLAQYSATIDTSNRSPLCISPCDRLGIMPGVDTIDFHDDRLYTLFILTRT